MDDRKLKFMEGVLGLDGASALHKAAERSSALGNALLPRTIIAWLGVAARADYEGEIPGCENTYLSFSKSENQYSGVIGVGAERYAFNSASLFHLASAIAVALGADQDHVDPSLKEVDIARLGKSIDVLAKMNFAKSFSAPPTAPAPQQLHNTVEGFMGGLKSLPKGSPERGKFITSHMNHGPFLSALKAHPQGQNLHTMLTTHLNSKANAGFKPGQTQAIAKFEPPGQTAKPRAQVAPAGPSLGTKQTGSKPAPTMNMGAPKTPTMQPLEAAGPGIHKLPSVGAPKMATPKLPKVAGPKTPSVKLTRSEAFKQCPVCARTQFREDNEFYGCLCFRELAKSTRIQDHGEEGFTVLFGRNWDKEAIEVFLESVGRK